MLSMHRRFVIALSSMHRFRGLALTFVVCISLGLLLADTFAPQVSVTLDPKSIQADEGQAFIVPISTRYRRIFELKADSSSEPAASSLRLMEDGKTLGPGHTSHELIRKNGTGAYSHWGAQLYFSTSDNSDPRTNGRRYVAQATTGLSSTLQIIGLVVLGCVGILFFREHMSRWTSIAGNPTVLESYPTIIGLMIGSAAVAVALVLYAWHGGSSMGFTVANFFPVSDARGYHACATSLAATGHFENGPWCSRRALYPLMLATLLGTAGWHGQIVLLLQAGLIGLAIMTLSVETARLLGWVGGALVFVALFVFAWEFALSAFVTEVAGLSLGLIGVALLLRFVGNPGRGLPIAGVALISIALTARAGAMLLLPALIVWGWLIVRNPSNGYRIRHLLPLILGVSAGPLLQAALLLALGIDLRNTGGNYAASLYGLSTGSRDWTEAYRDFADLIKSDEAAAFRHIYGAALSNIPQAPGVFIKALFEAGRHFVTSLFQFGTLAKANIALSLLLLVGLLACGHRRRTPLGSLLLIMAAAEAASAPLIIDSGGPRIFAASIAVRILVAAVGLQVTLSVVVQLLHRNANLYEISSTTSSGRPVLPLVLGGIIVLAIVLPITPLGNLFRLERLSGVGCPMRFAEEVVTRLDRESQTIGIADHLSESSLFPHRVTHERLASDVQLARAWWGTDFLALPSGSLVINAFQRAGKEFGKTEHLIWFGPFPGRHQNMASLCVDPKRSTTLGDVAYLHVISITPLRGAP
jgi:hypothetical protein